jgi:hypothetical protein
LEPSGTQTIAVPSSTWKVAMPRWQDSDNAPDLDDTPADRSPPSTADTPVEDQTTDAQDADDARVDLEGEESFPASDPPANY